MTIKPSDITALVELFDSSGWNELHVEVDGLQLFLSTDPNARLHGGTGAPAAVPRETNAEAGSAAAPATNRAAAPAPNVAANPPAQPVPDHWLAVTAPNLGTFYRSPKPGAAPFVEIGQSIGADSEVCLIEVMKLFTAVRAGTAGIVRRICVNDAELVEFGQVLLYIERG